MIKKGIVLLILSLSLFGCGEVDFSKLKYDESKYYLVTTGKLFTGKATEYYEKDKIKSVRNLKKGDLRKYILYYENGNIQEKGDGGIWNLSDWEIKRYDENGNIESVIMYKNGQKTGKSKFYYKSGKIKEEAEYICFIRNGKSVTYYENGNIESEKNYQDGLETGEAIYYNEDGSIKQRIKY